MNTKKVLKQIDDVLETLMRISNGIDIAISEMADVRDALVENNDEKTKTTTDHS